jgi:hypothetical protein
VKAIVLALWISALATVYADERPAAKQKKPNFTIGKETTYVTGPVDKDGYIDYAAALNERLGKGVTPENNANVLIWKALGPKPDGGKGMPAEFFKLMGMDVLPEKGEYFVSLTQYANDELHINLPELVAVFQNQLSAAAQSPWPAEMYIELAAWLKANAKPLALLVEATDRPCYFSPIEPTSPDLIGVKTPPLQSLQEVAKALVARAMLRTSEGQHDQAWNDLRACHRLGRLVAQGGFLIESLVGNRIDEIAQTADLAWLQDPRLDPKRISKGLKDLQSLPPRPTMTPPLDLLERFETLQSMMMVDRLGLHYLAAISGTVDDENRAPKGPLTNVNWDVALRNANTWYDRLAKISRETDRTTREHLFKQLEDDAKERASRAFASGDLEKIISNEELTPAQRGEALGDVVIKLLSPASWKLQQGIDRAEQRMRNLEVAFGLAIYERENGAYPQALDALAPNYLKKLPVDLYTGGSLAYRLNKNGYLLYSFGPNGQDDEGRGPKDDPKGDDIAVRMPVPKPAKK